tara:strand:+ start:16670 stop:17575 length:906 start_codon:yes stop_codon:yes gene_type:complete
MKILILGGTGYIGSNFIANSHLKNISITSISQKKKNFELKNVKYIYEDYNNIENLSILLQECDIIIHLINSTNPLTAENSFKNDIEGNLIKSIRLFKKIPKDKHIIYFSSGGTVYGNQTKFPISEDSKLSPINSYGIIKVALENYLKLFSKKNQFKYTIVRPSNIFGKKQFFDKSHGIIENTIFNIINDNTLKIWGDGHHIRDYLYIDDLVSFLDKLIHRKIYGIYNVGSGIGISNIDLVNSICEIMKKDIKIQHVKSKFENVDKVILDIKKAQSQLNWYPRIDFKKGLKMEIKWLKKILS